jgi:SAM-dependent methyltransferase
MTDSNHDFLARVRAEFERADRDGDEYTRPWLDLDTAAYTAYRQGRSPCLPAPYQDDPADRLMMENVQGQPVLCLAGGGGQQSAVFALLGAQVTVFDLMPAQLAGDQAAAAHYGYQVTTVQGDMHDLAAGAGTAGELPAAGFARVYQPISTLYCYDLARLYAGVWRVLRPGGLYLAEFAFPLLYLAEDLGWDEQGYLLRVREPYQRGAIRELADGRISLSEGQPIGEYHHLLSDIVNELVSAGFSLRGLWESPRPSQRGARLPAGMTEHKTARVPFGITVVGIKING